MKMLEFVSSDWRTMGGVGGEWEIGLRMGIMGLGVGVNVVEIGVNDAMTS